MLKFRNNISQAKRCFLCTYILLGLTLTVISPVESNTNIRGKVTIVDSKGKPLSDNSGVIVFLDELENYQSTPAKNSQSTIRQINKNFHPKVLPIVYGTEVEFPNEDFVFHNVFSLSKTQPFDLGLYKKGVTKSVQFDYPGLIKIYCNIHPQMIAHILVLANPFFTITDKNGNFEIANAPQGKASIRTWSAQVRDNIEEPIFITKEGVKDFEFSLKEFLGFQLKEENIKIKHKNKWGQEYPSKY